MATKPTTALFSEAKTLLLSLPTNQFDADANANLAFLGGFDITSDDNESLTIQLLQTDPLASAPKVTPTEAIFFAPFPVELTPLLPRVQVVCHAQQHYVAQILLQSIWFLLSVSVTLIAIFWPQQASGSVIQVNSTLLFRRHGARVHPFASSNVSEFPGQL